MPEKDRGFTLIEILVVVAIIGVVATIGMVALGDARRRGRDSKRMSDVRQIITALELYNNDNNGYPVEMSPVPLGVGTRSALCLGGFKAVCDPGEQIMMGIVPSGVLPVDGTCSATDNEYSYETPTGGEYVITFCIGDDLGDMAAGVHTASPSGIQ